MDTLRGRVAGVVLAGGLSSRMGRDKALLRVYGSDNPGLLARTHTLLTALLPQCWVSCRPGLSRAGYQCIFDEKNDCGPVAGVVAALRTAQAQGFSAVLALSCDMPFMDASTLRNLLAARNAAPADTLATLYMDAVSGRPEALSAVYETAALPWFEDSLAFHGGRLNRVVPLERQCRLPYGPEEARPFFFFFFSFYLQMSLDILSASY